MTYKWKEGSHHKVSAQVAGEVCEELEERGELNAENLVDVSRPEDAPLHDEFEWNDDIAAEMYRRTQAGAIIRHLAVKTETKAPVRAFFNIEVRNNGDIFMLKWIWADLDTIIDCFSDKAGDNSSATMPCGDDMNAETESIPDSSSFKGLFKCDRKA